MPLFFSYSNTLIQSHSRSVTQIPFPVSRHLLNFKISTETTTAWCHPTSTVAVTTASTAVCEHRLTPRLEDPCTDPPPPLPIQPPPSARSGDRPCCLSRLFRYQARAFEQLGRSTTPIRLQWSPFLHSPEANHGFYYLTGCFSLDTSPHTTPFIQEPLVTGIPWVAEDGFVDHDGFSGFLKSILRLLVFHSQHSRLIFFISVFSPAPFVSISNWRLRYFFFSPFVDINVNCFEGR